MNRALSMPAPAASARAAAICAGLKSMPTIR
jgi:hypothetical protein